MQHESGCQAAVANDRDINQLCEVRQFTEQSLSAADCVLAQKHGCEIPEDIPSFLQAIKPHIEVTKPRLLNALLSIR